MNIAASNPSSLNSDHQRNTTASLHDETAASVLVVDDERINREILSRMLRKQGYNVTTASSGEEALEHLRSRLPDLVLLDVIMTGINGFDVLREIRGQYRDSELPVIMVTAESDVTTSFERSVKARMTTSRSHSIRRSLWQESRCRFSAVPKRN